MCAHYLLQKDDICRGGAYRFTQFRQDEATVKSSKSLVGIDRQDFKGKSLLGLWHTLDALLFISNKSKV